MCKIIVAVGETNFLWNKHLYSKIYMAYKFLFFYSKLLKYFKFIWHISMTCLFHKRLVIPTVIGSYYWTKNIQNFNIEKNMDSNKEDKREHKVKYGELYILNLHSWRKFTPEGWCHCERTECCKLSDNNWNTNNFYMELHSYILLIWLQKINWIICLLVSYDHFLIDYSSICCVPTGDRQSCPFILLFILFIPCSS